MTFKEDIIERINSDFGERADEATKLLSDAIAENKKLNTDRVIRCIIYLAKGDMADLIKYIESAIIDTREVMFWAEYTGIAESKIPKRLRDFDKTFDKCSENVKG